MKVAQEDIAEESAIKNVAKQLAQFNILGPLYVKTGSFERPMNFAFYRMNANVGRFVTPSNPGAFVTHANPRQFVAPSNSGTRLNPGQIGTNFNPDYLQLHFNIWQIGTPNAEGDTYIRSNSNPLQYANELLIMQYLMELSPTPITLEGNQMLSILEWYMETTQLIKLYLIH